MSPGLYEEMARKNAKKAYANNPMAEKEVADVIKEQKNAPRTTLDWGRVVTNQTVSIILYVRW